MSQFYPGSKQVMRVNPGVRSPADDEGLFIGKPCLVVGDEEYFTIGSLAFAINRAAGTIRKWEADGIIPKPTRRKAGEEQRDKRGRRRIYTRKQIMGLRRIAREEGILETNAYGAWKSLDSTRFKDRAKKLFEQLEKE
jgi:hypothetical protein